MIVCTKYHPFWNGSYLLRVLCGHNKVLNPYKSAKKNDKMRKRVQNTKESAKFFESSPTNIWKRVQNTEAAAKVVFKSSLTKMRKDFKIQ
jgi:hypothetical protein